MQIVKSSESIKKAGFGKCEVIEYPMDAKAIDICIVKVFGRVPAAGYKMNEISDAACHVVSGTGAINEASVSAGDSFSISRGEKYFFDGEFTMTMSCTPAWEAEQGKEVE
ncbi:MAG: hypothetical protein LBI17_00945 [Rickettsiales bacterium]|jgi:hypothetical protein|nr:hypothetical protein [Rickettsiales bacterium]